jgi:hypothetical protein
MRGKGGKENKSYAGNIAHSQKRTDAINKKLSEMVENMTHPYTQSEIAEYCLMSKQAVYQIELKAKKKMYQGLKDIYKEWCR